MEKEIKKGNKSLIIKIVMVVLVVALITTAILIPKASKFSSEVEFKYGSQDFSYGKARLSVLSNKEVDRQIVKESDGGLESYPAPNNVIRDEELKKAIMAENIAMMDFEQLDENGNFYKDGIKTDGKLIKHSIAGTHFLGKIDNDAPAFERTVTIDPHELGNNMTGLYVPAGEVVKIQVPKELVGKYIVADIGRMASRGDVINIPLDREFSRMPHANKSIHLKNEINYVGSPLGGPLYLRLEGVNKPVTFTITGAIEYPHFILGTSSKTELDRLLVEAKGLIFDLEVPGVVRLTMPVNQIEGIAAEELIEAAIFWEKFGSLSNYIDQGDWFRKHLVTQIHDSYVPAGAAVAFVGRSFSVSPISWGRATVNINETLKRGTWGNFHEFNHHHQSSLGASGGGEVTNNVATLLSYMEYSNISSSRQFNKGVIDGGWNNYLDPTHALKELHDVSAQNTRLSMYVPMIHSFGVKKFAEAYRIKTGGKDTNFYRNMSDNLGYDLTYYLRDLNKNVITDEDVKYIKSKNYPVYVPVSTVYQVGQEQQIYEPETFTYKNEVVKTNQPYVVDVNQKINISESIVVPKGFKFNITDISKPINGNVENVDGEYIYTPLKENEYDELKVKVEMTNGTHYSEQTLVLGFGVQTTRAKQEVTTTLYSNPNNTITMDNLLDYEQLEIKDSKTTAAGNVAFNGGKNDIMVTAGQFVMKESKEYTIYVAADDLAIMYVGKDRNKLKEVARIDEYMTDYSKDREGSYFKIKIEKDVPVYFKLIVKNNDGKVSSKIGYDNGNKIVNLPNDQVYDFDGELSYKNYFKPLGSFEFRYSEKYTVSQNNKEVNATVTATDNIQPYDDSYNLSNIVDGENYGGFHSKVTLNNFPGSITIAYDELMKFNTIQLYSLRNEGNPRALPKDIRISISKDGNVFNEVFKGKTKPTQKNDIKLDSFYEATHIKIDIYTSHRENYIGIGEVRLINTSEEGNIFNAINSGTSNHERFNVVSNGPYINGFALETNKETLKFKFKGESIALYSAFGSEYGVMSVRVNGGKWTQVDLSSEDKIYGKLAYAEFGLPNEINEIEIKSHKKGLINIDYFITNEVIAEVPNEINWNKILLITIPILVVVVLGSVGFTVFSKKKKKSIKKL